MSVEVFDRYWLNVHGPLVQASAEVLGIEKYVQHMPLEASVNERIVKARGTPRGFDGVAEIVYPSLETWEASLANEAARMADRRLRSDEGSFIDTERSPLFIVNSRTLYERD